jgi:hypothetical protein
MPPVKLGRAGEMHSLLNPSAHKTWPEPANFNIHTS